MGQQTSFQRQSPQITDRSFSYIGQPSSRRSATASERAIKTVTIGNIQELNLLKEMFNFRLKNRDYLTHCYGFQVIQVDQGNNFYFSCISAFSSMKVNFYYEKITDKFSQLYQISVDQGFRLLTHCLKGFSILYDHFGYFTPQSQHINKQGDEWKVWINENIFALKSRNRKQTIKKQFQKQKFLQQVVHLFDALRDEEQPQFSYSVFIYRSAKQSQCLPYLSLQQILGLLNESIQQQKSFKENHHSASLKRLSFSSNETVRGAECKSLISSDEKENESTLPKFMTDNKKMNKSLYESTNIKKVQKQSIKQDIFNNQCLPRHSSFLEQGKNNSNQQNKKLKYTKTSSKIIDGALINEAPQHSSIQMHVKDKYSLSTTSNCTGWTKNMTPLKMLSNYSKAQIGVNQRSFIKKDMSCFISVKNLEENRTHKELSRGPIKITENSEISSESDQIDFRNKNFDQAFLSSYRSIGNEENQYIDPIQFISKNPTSNNTPSIAHKTRKCGKQTMKLLKDCLLNNSRGEHKRSLTDETCHKEIPKEIKYCWSQEFDSQFLSFDSRKENIFPSRPEFASENINYVQYLQSEKQDSEVENGIEDKKEQEQNLQEQKKKKQVKIANNQDMSVYSYQKTSEYAQEKSQIGQRSHNSNNNSTRKLPYFKSESGFKGFLRNNKRLSTLQSIKQIEVDYPIDQDILGDLNKMFTKHQFAKSSQLTQPYAT